MTDDRASRDTTLELMATAIRKRVNPPARDRLLKLIDEIRSRPVPVTEDEIERERAELRKITNVLGMPLLQEHKRDTRPPKQGSLF